MELKYEIDAEFGTNIIGEMGNGFTAVRKISWNEKDEKVDIRKYAIDSNGEEKMRKGIAITDEEANELVNILIEKGYGTVKNIIDKLEDEPYFIYKANEVLKTKTKKQIKECIILIDNNEEEEDCGFNPNELFDEKEDIEDEAV